MFFDLDPVKELIMLRILGLLLAPISYADITVGPITFDAMRGERWPIRFLRKHGKPKSA